LARRLGAPDERGRQRQQRRERRVGGTNRSCESPS
jgi:hypothetical protein